MNTTISTRIMRTCVFSLISFMKFLLMKSSVSVELDAITSEESVDMDADNTSRTTRPISASESPDSIVGIIESNPFATTST